MAPKGTSSLGDVATDIKMAFGYKDKRFKDAQQKLNQIKSKYPNNKIDIAGHSLGAKVVEEIGANDDRVNNIYTLNKPTTPYDILFNRNKKNDKQIDIRSKKDIVSVLKPLENKNSNDIYIEPETNNILKEHKIDILDRLDENQIIGNGLGFNGKTLKLYEIKAILKIIKKHRKDLDIIITGKKKNKLLEMLIVLLQ